MLHKPAETGKPFDSVYDSGITHTSIEATPIPPQRKSIRRVFLKLRTLLSARRIQDAAEPKKQIRIQSEPHCIYEAGVQDGLTSANESGIVSNTTNASASQKDEVHLHRDIDNIMHEVFVNGNVDDSWRFDSKTVREYYKKYVEEINDLIDNSATLEQRARQAFELRNKYRTNARRIMADVVKREFLDKKRRNKTFDELVKDKISRKGLTYEEALQDIINTATHTNKQVNFELGVE